MDAEPTPTIWEYVASALWRNTLRRCPDEKLSAEKDAAATREVGLAVWVLPWGEIKKPSLALR